MKELQAILEALDRTDPAGPQVLATVVRVQGSSYRRPGARMLLLADGTTVGTVSGGCLEGDVKLRAWASTAGGRPTVLRYDSTSDGDLAWQLGLGCRGVVDVLVERLPEVGGPLCCPRRWLAERRLGVLARVVAADDAAVIGQFMGFDETGVLAGDVTAGEIHRLLVEGATASFQACQSSYGMLKSSLGRLEVFFEAIVPPRALLICGAGHDAMPLVRLAKELGWHVTVVDPRPSYATAARFPLADMVRVVEPEHLARDCGRLTLPMASAPANGSLILPNGGAAVVMSHNYHNDRLFLRALLPSAVRYLGVLGPKDRTERLLEELVGEGVEPTAAQMERLHGPVGLDLAANTPEEIALAVIAEIQAVFAGRTGGSLRTAIGPLHERRLEPAALLPPGEFGLRSCLVEHP